MTTYDDVWSEFISINQTDTINLPNTQLKTYNSIHSAIRHYNTRLGSNIKYDDVLELLDEILSDYKLTLVAHYIRVSFFENQLIDLTTTYSPFQADIGIRNYQEQSRNFKELIDREDNKIETIITNNYDGDYM